MKKLVLLLFALFVLSCTVSAQRGRIIRAASTNAMDPNGDGFVSKTTAGFSNDGYNVDEFEITMFGIPQVDGDVAGDNTGNSCGITDLIPDNKGHSVYAVLDGNNLIFRFRVGDDNPSVESWSILLDTDGLFGAADPNSTPGNPGFEVDITLIKRNNAGVYVYNINGVDNCPTAQLSYSISSNFQISIADEVSCGDPDYFYDFYVPFNQIASAFGISTNSGLRFVALSNVSATCALGGNIADVSGVDNDAPEYANCTECAFAALVDNQCPTAIDDLCQTCGGFEKDKVNKPTIDVPVRAGQTTISGTCDPNIYIKVEVYSRTGGTDAAPVWSTTPRETQGNTAVGIIWSVPLNGPLQSFDKIVAKAQKDVNSVPCGTAGGNQASASVTVVQPNTRPSAVDQNVNVTEDIAANITLTGTDAENDPLIFTVVTPPAHGTLSGTGANVLYTPSANYFGPDAFTFHVSDGIFSSLTPGTVTINVAAVNDAPVAAAQAITTPEETVKAITLSGTDVDGGTLTYSIVSAPSHGTLSGSGSNITYTPALNYNGGDSFTFKANDGTVDSNIATITIDVTAVQDIPVANAQAVTIQEDEVKAIVLTGSDADGQVISFIIVSNPAHGTLSDSGANRTYTPAADYFGSDGFTFKTNDGISDSDPATVSITINPVNDPPIANIQTLTTPEDTALPITLTGTDADGNTLTYNIVTPPAHGSLTGSAPSVTYTPALNYNGPDNFSFTVNDGLVTSSAATISIGVTIVNDAPVAAGQNVTVTEDTPKPITVSATDIEGDALSYILVTPPGHGVLSGPLPSVTYTPDLNYNGPDVFTFKANDGAADSNPADVLITVTAVNDAPIANSQSVTYQLNTAKAFTLTGSDIEGNMLSFIVLSNPTNGVLSGVVPNLTYTPNNGFTGPDNFTFKVNDGTTDSNIATVSLFEDPGVNVAPIASAGSPVDVDEDVPTTIILTATDANGDLLTFSIVTPPANGSITLSGANAIYTPNLNYVGPDQFEFKANDGNLDSNIPTVSITVNPINDAPVAIAQNVATPENTGKAITLSATDPDGDPINSYSIVGNPTHGILSGTAPNVTYTPNTGFIGVDNFSFKANDGLLDSNPATVSIVVSAVNDLPVANGQIVTTNEDVVVAINLTASDADLDPLTYSVTEFPAHGNLTGTAPNFTYTPTLNFNGTDAIKFVVNDGTGNSNPATVSITVLPVNDLPAVQSQSLSTAEDNSLPIVLNGSDPDGDNLDWLIVSQPLHGTLTGTAPDLTYEPAANYNGPDNFTFSVNDGTTNSNLGRVSIDVTAVPDAPVAFDQDGATTPENVPITIIIVGSDPDGDNLTYIIVDQPAHGTLTGTGPDQVYTPDDDYTGTDTFTFKVNDGTNDSNTATVTITITPVSGPPTADPQTLTVDEDSSIAFALTGSDPDNDVLNYTILSQVSHGALSGISPSLVYTPLPDYNGPDELTFKVDDGSADSNIATISFTVMPVNDAPSLSSIPDFIIPEDSTLRVCLNAVDIDGDAIIFGQPTNRSGGGGMVRDVAPYDFCYIFTPVANYNGESLWTMSVSDASGQVASTDVKITITPVNDPPAAIDDMITVLRFVPASGNVLANDSDIDGDAIAVNITPVTNPAHGTIAFDTDGTFTYTSERTYRGEDSMEYEVCDSGTPSLCSHATLTINIEDEAFKVFEGVTPNGDGNNDYLRIEGIDYYTENVVKIFDRYNNLVFEMRGYDNEENVWKGQSNMGIVGGTLPEGTYFYLVDLGDNSPPRKGFVVLKRN